MGFSLCLVRHGESEANVRHMLSGWMDVDLTDNGRKELLINKWQTRPKGHSSFDIYDLQSNPKKLTEPPFDKYDHMTRVDSINKTITLYEGSRISGCAVSHTYQLHYRLHIPVDTRSAFPVISVQSPVSIQYRWQS